MKVQEIMTTPVGACRPDTNLASVAMEMWRTDCGVLPVVDDVGKVVGMITDRDICMAAAIEHHRLDEIAVGAVITGMVKSCTPEEELSEVLRTMRQERVRRLPVVDQEGKLKGIVSINDVILEADAKHGGVTSKELVETLKGISAHWLPAVAPNGANASEPAGNRDSEAH